MFKFEYAEIVIFRRRIFVNEFLQKPEILEGQLSS